METIPEPPLHPVTGEPITGEQLIMQSDQLDQHMGSDPGIAKLVTLIEDTQHALGRARRVSYVLAGVVAVLAVVSVVLSFVVVRVDHNASRLNQTRSAIKVYCDQSNVYNAQARQNFIVLFDKSTHPERIKAIADVAWPSRDCAAIATASPDTLPVVTALPPLPPLSTTPTTTP